MNDKKIIYAQIFLFCFLFDFLRREFLRTFFFIVVSKSIPAAESFISYAF